MIIQKPTLLLHIGLWQLPEGKGYEKYRLEIFNPNPQIEDGEINPDTTEADILISPEELDRFVSDIIGGKDRLRLLRIKDIIADALINNLYPSLIR